METTPFQLLMIHSSLTNFDTHLCGTQQNVRGTPDVASDCL